MLAEDVRMHGTRRDSDVLADHVDEDDFARRAGHDHGKGGAAADHSAANDANLHCVFSLAACRT
jgi:hypothetical protein